MCEPVSASTATAVSIASAVAAAAGTAVSVYGANKSQNAAADAHLAETKRQGNLQRTQSAILDQQQASKAKGQQAFQETLKDYTPKTFEDDQNTAAASLTQPYADASQMGANNPLANAADISTVNADGTASTGPAPVPLAISNAYANEQTRALNFGKQQSKARAFLDALSVAQRRNDSRMLHGAEKIGMFADQVSGDSGTSGLYENLKDSSNANFQIHSTNAARAGDAFLAAGQAAQTIGQLGYGYGTTAKTKP